MSTEIEKLKERGMKRRNNRFKFPGMKQVSHGAVMYSMGNIVNNIVLVLYGVRWLLD